MAAPDHLSFRSAARFGMNQPDTLVQGNVRSYDRQTTGVAHIDRDSVGMFTSSTLIPLHKQLHAGNDTFMASQSFPSFLYCGVWDVGGEFDGHYCGPLCGIYRGRGVDQIR